MMDFQARYVLVQPAGAEPPTGEDADVFGHVVSLGEDVAEAGKALASYIFDKGDGAQEDKPEGDASDKAAEQSTEPATNGDAPQPQQDMEVDGGA